MRTGLITKKLGMSAIYTNDGGHIPVTVLKVDNCQVVSQLTEAKDGYEALQLGVGFVPIRKGGKLPYHTFEAEYDLEYGTDTLAIHQDAFPAASRVLICDDVIATGGTIAASIGLVEELGGEVTGISVLIELAFLKGREKFEGYDVFSLIEF